MYRFMNQRIIDINRDRIGFQDFEVNIRDAEVSQRSKKVVVEGRRQIFLS